MRAVVIILGIAAVCATWYAISHGRLSVWRMPWIMLALGVIAVLFGDVAFSGSALLTGSATAVARGAAFGFWLGLLVGVALFGSTRLFLAVADRWAYVRRLVEAQYGPTKLVSLPAAVGLSIVSVLGEEFFWRGLVQPSIASGLGSGQSRFLVAAFATFVLFAFANMWSRSVPIIAAAILGGAIWSILPLVTAGILASLCCHLVWTVGMLVLPPSAAKKIMSG